MSTPEGDRAAIADAIRNACALTFSSGSPTVLTDLQAILAQFPVLQEMVQAQLPQLQVGGSVPVPNAVAPFAFRSATQRSGATAICMPSHVNTSGPVFRVDEGSVSMLILGDAVLRRPRVAAPTDDPTVNRIIADLRDVTPIPRGARLPVGAPVVETVAASPAIASGQGVP